MDIVKIAEIITASLVILGFLWNVFSQYMKFKNYDKRIKTLSREMEDLRTENIARMQSMMAEQCLQTRLFDAVLDGLEQLGCNHTVPKARKELNEFLNERAHEVKI